MDNFNGPLQGNEHEPGCQSQRRAIQDTCDVADARRALSEPGDRVDSETLHDELGLNQPDALARLEAWLAADRRRGARFRWSVSWGYEVILTLRCDSGLERYASECERDNTNIEKTGLAATIHAALDKADEVKM